MIYLMTEQGDANHVDINTRRNMLGHDSEVHVVNLFKIGWFILGMIVGSALHDKVFHAIEQIIK